jgi:hypothetical protein
MTTTSPTAGDVADTAKQQAREVAGEVRTQARSLSQDVRYRVREQARTQNDRLVQGIRQMADEMGQMAADRGDSTAGSVVSRIADSGHELADYLSKHGPDGVLNDVRAFAQRRPGAFLATALVSGFVVGRLGRGVLAAQADSGIGSSMTSMTHRAEPAMTPAAPQDRLTAATRSSEPTVPLPAPSAAPMTSAPTVPMPANPATAPRTGSRPQ